MATAIVASSAQGVIDALNLSGTSIQPADLVVPTGVGQADGLMRHQDKARLDSLGAYYDRALVHAIMLSF